MRHARGHEDGGGGEDATAGGRGPGARDAGQETVGYALLITVAAAGALAIGRLSGAVVAAFESFQLPLG